MKARHILLTALFFVISSLSLAGRRPEGPGWKAEQLADGIFYYSFSGIEEVSGAAQQIFVIDQDLSNKKYDHAGQRKRDTHFYIVAVQDGPAPAPILPDWSKAAGLDLPYDMTPKTLTPAPRGYKATYISHYGRHGSRYAYTSDTYNIPLEMLRDGAAAGNLTPRGRKLLDDLKAFMKVGQYKVGDLTPLGWEQHDWIARTMVKEFPDAFKKGSRIDACSSGSVRSILSMASECATFSREAPKADVYAHQSKLDIQATRPNEGRNPFRYEGPALDFPYRESSEAFFYRHFPMYKDVLGRMFKDPAASLKGRDAYNVFFYFYMLVAGMNSLPEEERIDMDGLLTPEEYAILWETDNYERFREYYPYQTPCSSIIDDMVAKADARLAEGSTGADLRFGHDHVLMTLLMIMDIDGSGTVPESPDEIGKYFRSYMSPMATNLQMVFYTPRCNRNGDVLVKILLNGEETRFGSLPAVSGPYYRWTELRDYLNSRTALFTSR